MSKHSSSGDSKCVPVDSYRPEMPIPTPKKKKAREDLTLKRMVGLAGFEPATKGL